MAARGRGSNVRPKNRFVELEAALDDPAYGASRTKYLVDHSKTIIARNGSPDVGFDASVNPYRGCECGCPYCFARPTHEYLGFDAGLDFESIIMVKPNAAALLRAELAKPSWRPQVLGLSGVTDPYQPVETKLQITRNVLKVLAEFRNPVSVITKRATITRDADVLADLARYGAAQVTVSVTTLNIHLARSMEPRASTPPDRLKTIRTLADSCVPVSVNVAPVIPGLNDHEIPAILRSAAEHGATAATMILLRLPHSVKNTFEEWLRRAVPLRADKVMARIRDARGGKLNDPTFGARMRGTGVYADQVRALFRLERKRLGLGSRIQELRTDAFLPPGGVQEPLFT
jgi:DNA repair photolyase